MHVRLRRQSRDVLREAVEIVTVARGHEQRLAIDVQIVLARIHGAITHGCPLHSCPTPLLREPDLTNRGKLGFADDELSTPACEVERARHGTRGLRHRAEQRYLVG